jgi:DnaK suppressor protein
VSNEFDRAQELEEFDRDLALRAHMARQAQEAGNGICIDCREPIEAKRLEAVPTALRCMDCQTGEDKRASRYARRGA